MAGAPLKTKIPLEKANTLPEDVPIYNYSGHGVDMCDLETGELIIDTVPDNCIYVTIEECGLPTFYNAKFDTFFASKENQSRDVLRYPYFENHLKVLAEKTGIDEKKFHIHLPGSSYVVSKFSPINVFNKVLSGVSYSGLVKKSIVENLKIDENPFPRKEKALEKYQTKFNSYTSRWNFDSKLQEVFIDNPEVLELLKKPMAGRLLSLMFPSTFDFTPKQILDYIENLKYTIPVETFIEYFRASVFPTPDQIAKAIRDHTDGFYKGFLYIFEVEELQRHMNTEYDSELTNRSLMERFPGIHYNTTCRFVSEGCIEKSVQRRKLSFNAETERRLRYSQTLGPSAVNAEEVPPGSLYKYLLHGIDSIHRRAYPKAKDKRDLLFIRKGAIYNVLVNLGDSLNVLTKEERKQIVNELVLRGLLSKKIQEILRPQAGGRKTRRRSASGRRTTRKALKN